MVDCILVVAYLIILLTHPVLHNLNAKAEDINIVGYSTLFLFIYLVVSRWLKARKLSFQHFKLNKLVLYEICNIDFHFSL